MSRFRQGGQGQGTAGGKALFTGGEEFRIAAGAELGVDDFADAQSGEICAQSQGNVNGIGVVGQFPPQVEQKLFSGPHHAAGSSNP